MGGGARQRVRAPVALQHVRDVVHDRIRQAPFDIRIEVGGVGGEHHPAPPRVHAHHLQSHGVAAHAMQAQARRDLIIAVVKNDASGEDFPDHRDHVLLVERKLQMGMAHAAAR